MAKNDRRVQYTKRVLQEAVLELLKTKSIDALTIKEVCELADVNRGTFYLHYTQPRDVLLEIENQFIEENTAICEDYRGTHQDPIAMSQIFTCIMENKMFSSILLGENGDPQFLHRLEDLCRNGVINKWKEEFPQYKKESLDFLFDYVFIGSMRLILKWIENDRGLSAKEFAQRLERLGHYSLIAVKDFAK